MIGFIAVFLIAILQALEDTIQYHFHQSIFRNRSKYSFWGKESWVRKYKYGNPEAGPKFFGSTTFLVWLTDGWHLIKFLYLLIAAVAIAYNTSLTTYFGLDWWWKVAETALLFTIYGLVFELFYKFIFRKR